jgi:hypothetical protein
MAGVLGLAAGVEVMVVVGLLVEPAPGARVVEAAGLDNGTVHDVDLRMRRQRQGGRLRAVRRVQDAGRKSVNRCSVSRWSACIRRRSWTRSAS